MSLHNKTGELRSIAREQDKMVQACVHLLVFTLLRLLVEGAAEAGRQQRSKVSLRNAR